MLQIILLRGGVRNLAQLYGRNQCGEEFGELRQPPPAASPPPTLARALARARLDRRNGRAAGGRVRGREVGRWIGGVGEGQRQQLAVRQHLRSGVVRVM
jgi:hypothetical protein